MEQCVTERALPISWTAQSVMLINVLNRALYTRDVACGRMNIVNFMNDTERKGNVCIENISQLRP